MRRVVFLAKLNILGIAGTRKQWGNFEGMIRPTTILPHSKSPLEMVAANWLAGLVAVMAVSLASARAEEPPRLSLQSTSDFASYGAFYTDLTATYSPFGNLWGARLARARNRVCAAL
jgi:hypothetical protein